MIRPKHVAIFMMNTVLLVLSLQALAGSVFQIKGTVIAVNGFEATIQVERTIAHTPAVGNKVDLLETNAAGNVVLVRKDWEITEIQSGLVKARPVNATAHDLPKVNMKAVIHILEPPVQASPEGKGLLTYHDAFPEPKEKIMAFSKAEGKVIMIRGDVVQVRMNDPGRSATVGDNVKLSYSVGVEVIPVGTWRVSVVKENGLLEALPIEMKGKPNVGMDALIYLQERPKGASGKDGPPKSVAAKNLEEPSRLEQACQQGNADACTDLGYLYGTGKGMTLDYQRAVTLYRQACNGGSLPGCKNLGIMYRDGLGVNRDYRLARELFQKACDGGIADGCGNLGLVYQQGLGVGQDFRRAVELLQKGCDGGNGDACTNLGYLYGTGQGVTLDYQRAAAFYRQACNGGSLHGCKNLGIMCRDGLGMDRDYRLAGELFQKACDGGNADGCGNLGWMFYAGTGTATDQARGQALMDQACLMGDSWSCSKLKELGQKK